MFSHEHMLGMTQHACCRCSSKSHAYMHHQNCLHVPQVAKHTPELAQLVVGAGGVGALVDYVGATKGNTRLPGIMALGYIAAFSETLGLSVIAEKGLVSIKP